MSDEQTRQSWGEQRARNSGWTGEQDDCSNPRDYRFESFGIVRRVGKLINVDSPLATPCVVPESPLANGHPRTKHLSETSYVRFHIPLEFWNFRERYLDRHPGTKRRKDLDRRRKTKRVTVQIAKFTALQFGLKFDHRWFLDEHVANVAIHRATPGERASFYLSRHCTTDHVCRNSSCLNPGHLQFVPNSENIFRISVPDLSDTIPCFIEDCSFEVRCTWPVGFNVCQACGGKAPYVYVIEQPKQMELFNSELQIRSRVLPKPIPVERLPLVPRFDQTVLEVGAAD